MHAYVWYRDDGLTDSHHDGGAVIAIAPDLAAARIMIRERYGNEHPLMDAHPDVTADLEKSGPMMWVFPDAGCC